MQYNRKVSRSFRRVTRKKLRGFLCGYMPERRIAILRASYRCKDWLEIGSYYSILYPNKNDKDGRGYEIRGGNDFQAWQKAFAFTTRFDINKYWLLKLEAHAVDGAADIRQYGRI